MKSGTLRVDGPFVIGKIAASTGTLDSPVRVDIFLGDVRAGTAIADKVSVPSLKSGAAKLTSFEFRLQTLAPELSSPVISASAPDGTAFGFTAWNADSRRMARWLGDAEAEIANALSADDVVSFSDDFARFAKWRPVTVLRNMRAAAAIVGELAITLCATGSHREAAQLLGAFPLFACLRSGDAALFEALRIIADEADWRSKRRLAALLAFGARRSAAAGAMTRRMRLSGDRKTGQADAAWLRRLMNDSSAGPALRAFAAETLALHTTDVIAGPQ